MKALMWICFVLPTMLGVTVFAIVFALCLVLLFVACWIGDTMQTPHVPFSTRWRAFFPRRPE